MPQRRLFWQLYRWIFVTTLVVTAIAAWIITSGFKSSLESRALADLKARAALVASDLDPNISPDDSIAATRLVTAVSSKAGVRVTLIRRDGSVLADSQEPSSQAPNQSRQPEVAAALRGDTGSATRFSSLTAEKCAYVAQPLHSNSSVEAIIRFDVPIGYIDRVADAIRLKILILGLLLALLLALVSWSLARRLGQPLMELQQNAERFAKGDFAEKAALRQSGDFVGLAAAMGTMASQLDERIQTVTRQRNEQEAILASMAEGLVAVDREEKILSINRVAASLLELEPDRAVGKTIQEVIRHTDLQQIISKTLADGAPVEEDIVL
ncbi:MAG TPA: PAS domain-containing protein, partial [Candidatus Acidoferrum sp.]|nr:PAS domain-containing protein [Candidatus Acidoferrum sp.]